jgi:hypothetical protein
MTARSHLLRRVDDTLAWTQGIPGPQQLLAKRLTTAEPDADLTGRTDERLWELGEHPHGFLIG